MRNNKVVFYSILLSLGLMACQGNPNPGTSNSEPPAQNKDVSVYVLSGQSNMEGSTFYDNGHDYLRNYMNSVDLDPQPCFDGIYSVLTSYYGYYPGYTGNVNRNWQSITPHCSNPDDPISGKFLPTKVGMGNDDRLMGPEIGLAYTLRNYASSNKPIFLIKCAFSGSGFSHLPGWRTKNDNTSDDLYQLLKTYVHNNLKIIEDMDLNPVIKGFLWHQGESDTGNNNYEDDLDYLVGGFREEFADYAPSKDKNKIAFIDCTIFDGSAPNISYGEGGINLNKQKMAFAEKSDYNFCINASTKDPDGLNLVIGGGQPNSDVDGCFNIYHYKTPDCYRLGAAYAQVIINNNLI